LDAIDFKYYGEYKTSYHKDSNEPQILVDSKYFTTKRYLINTTIKKEYPSNDSFVIYVIVDGESELYYGQDEKISIKKGDALLIPACINQVRFEPTSTISLLEVIAH